MSGNMQQPACSLEQVFGAAAAAFAPRLAVVALIGALNACHKQLWALEDRARSRTADDHRIAQIKRQIDRYNGERHRVIDRIDEELNAPPVTSGAWGQIYSETVGELCDRLLIVRLKMENLARLQADPELAIAEQQSCAGQLERYRRWQAHLQTCLAAMLADVGAGRALLPPRAERKLYNEARFNPVTRAEESRRGPMAAACSATAAVDLSAAFASAGLSASYCGSDGP